MMELKRALLSWGFMIGIAGMMLAVFFGAFNSFLPVLQGEYDVMQGFTWQVLFDALDSQVIMLALPLLCALPFTASFVDDYRSRYLRLYLPRAGERSYTRAKVAATAIAGGLVLFIGVFIALLISALVFIPMEVAPEPVEVPEWMMENMTPGIDISGQIQFVELLGKAVAFFLSGCLWSLVGGWLATVTMSKYMAYASPFILYYVLVILCERYFTSLYVINPKEWVAPAGYWAGGSWGIYLFLLELIILLSFVYSYCIKRRLAYA